MRVIYIRSIMQMGYFERISFVLLMGVLSDIGLTGKNLITSFEVNDFA